MQSELERFGYLLQGGDETAPVNSCLLSTSRYLNDPALRDWVATESLRRNGPDLPGGFGVPQLYVIMQRLSDEDRINRLFAAARQRDPALARWLDERFVSSYRKNHLRDYPQGTLGGAYFAMLDAANLEVEILPAFEPRSDAQYFMLRAQQTHDIEHTLAGLQANAIGEMGTITLRIANFCKVFDAELAGELSVFNSLLLTACMNRTLLHYPQCWPAFWESMACGTRVGQMSGPFFMARYEDLFGLPVETVRERVGIRGVEGVLDTSRISESWRD